MALYVLLTFNAFADAKYNSEKNIVVLGSTQMVKADSGSITIYSEKHVELFAYGMRGDNLAVLCGQASDLGALIFLDNKMQVGVSTPGISGANPWVSPEDQRLRDDGYVHSYIFKDDNALDLMDLLYEYSSVGFVLSNDGCKGDTAVLTVGFETRGIERAMKRIK